MTVKTLRAGVIGVGVMGWNHARTLRAMPGVELVGVADPSGAQRERAEQTFGCRGFATREQLFAAGVDFVVVATPNSAHQDDGIAALNAGLHVLIEKPIAATIEQAEALIHAAEQANRSLMVGHIERFNPAVKVAHAASVGEKIISINITRVGPFPPRMSEVGVVIDLGVHDIDLIRMLARADIVSVQAQLSSARAEREDTALLQFRTANDIIAAVTTNWITPYKTRSIAIATERKYILADLITRQVSEFFDYKADGSYSMRHLSVPPGDALMDEITAFTNAIRTGSQPPISGLDGLRNLQIAMECLNVGGRPL